MIFCYEKNLKIGHCSPWCLPSELRTEKCPCQHSQENLGRPRCRGSHHWGVQFEQSLWKFQNLFQEFKANFFQFFSEFLSEVSFRSCFQISPKRSLIWRDDRDGDWRSVDHSSATHCACHRHRPQVLHVPNSSQVPGRGDWEGLVHWILDDFRWLWMIICKLDWIQLWIESPIIDYRCWVTGMAIDIYWLWSIVNQVLLLLKRNVNPAPAVPPSSFALPRTSKVWTPGYLCSYPSHPLESGLVGCSGFPKNSYKML